MKKENLAEQVGVDNNENGLERELNDFKIVN